MFPASTVTLTNNLLDNNAGTSGTNGFTNLSYSYTGPEITNSTYTGILTITALPTSGYTTTPVESFDSSGARQQHRLCSRKPDIWKYTRRSPRVVLGRRRLNVPAPLCGAREKTPLATGGFELIPLQAKAVVVE